MKTSFALAAAAATLAVAEQPKFLNTEFNVEPNVPFTLKYSGCENGCDIILQNGDSKNLDDVQTLLTDVKGSESTITLSKAFPQDLYAFKITTEGEDPNYSEQFTFEGAEVTTTANIETSTVATSSVETSTVVKTTTTSAAETTTEAETTTTETSTEASTPAPESSSTDATTTAEESSTQTDDSDAAETTVPGAAPRMGASNFAMIAGVAALAVYFL